MADNKESVVHLDAANARLHDGVLGLAALTAEVQNGCRVFVHYNGPTDQLAGMCTGMAVLDPAPARTLPTSTPRRNS